MDFLKKHYEKVLLGAVLLGLAVAVGFLPFKIAADRTALEESSSKRTNPNVKPLTNLDLTIEEETLKRAATPVVINFSKPHKLFNPLPWQKTAEGKLIPFDDEHVGPKAVAVTKLKPLFTRLTLDSITMVDSGPRYAICLEREAALNPKERPKKTTYVSTNGQTDFFVLKEVQGPLDSPTNLVLELKDNGQHVNVSKEQKFERVDGYTADLAYKPENKTWFNRRVNSLPPLSLAGEEYNIVAISTNEVVLSAKSNQKKWPIPCNPK